MTDDGRTIEGANGADVRPAGRRGEYRTWMGLGIGLLFFFMLVGFGFYVIALMSSLERQNLVLAELQKEAEGGEKLLEIIAPGDFRRIPLTAADHTSAGRGIILVSRQSSEGILVVSGLDSLKGNEVYRLWYSKGGEPNAGVAFAPARTGPTYVSLGQITYVDRDNLTVVVTMEEGTESEKPAGSMVLVGAPVIEGKNDYVK